MIRPEKTERPEPPKDWRHLLLAYVDGCATQEERRAVELWLQANPAAAETLRELEALSPQQREFWQAVEPKQPDDVEWEPVRSAIQLALPKCDQTPTSGSVRFRTKRILFAVIGLAFSILLTLGLLLHKSDAPKVEGPPDVVLQPTQLPAELDPLAEYDVLPIATERDVMVSVVRGDRTAGFVACDHPVPGILALASSDELEVIPRKNMSPGTAWEISQPEPEDAPLLMNTKGK